MPKVDLLVLALTSPIRIGVYENDNLIREIESDQKSSEYLPTIFRLLLKEYEVETLIYANGPGSFMAIKMSYLFLKTLEIVKGIRLQSVSAFACNQYSPIKAMGKLYFHFKDDEVEIAPLGDAVVYELQLPKQLDRTIFSDDTAPNYVVPAV